MKFKVCGIKTEEEVLMVNKYPFDYVGFIFADSKRKVDKIKARELVEKLDEKIPVGVFVNEDVYKVVEIVNYVGLQIVQLHGDESLEYIELLKGLLDDSVKVWKTVFVDKALFLKYLTELKVDGVLFETKKDGAYGGTGESFNWRLLEGLQLDKDIILAGGVGLENILEAVKANIDIIDMNSKLETNLYKDEDKIKDIFSKLQGENIEKGI